MVEQIHMKLPPMNLPGPSVPYMRALEKIALEAAKSGNRAELNLNAIRRAAMGAGAAVDLAKTRLDEIEKQALLPALPPTGVEGSQSWAWDELGRLTADLTVSWEASTLAANGTPINVAHYAVWIREESIAEWQRATATPDLTVTIPNLKPQVSYYVRVQSITAGGIASGFTNELLVQPAPPLAPVPAPTPPILLSEMGVVSISWDGALSEGNYPVHFDYVDALMAETVGGPYVHVGTNFRREGSFVLADLTIGEDYFFKFHVHDKFHQLSQDSYVSSITVQGVDLGTLEADVEQLQLDLDAAEVDVQTALGNAGAAQTAADAAQADADAAQVTASNAQTAASTAQADADAAAADAAAAAGVAAGKGKVLIQSAAPAADDQLAQNLWIDTTGGANTPKRWTGSAWVAVTDKAATDAASAAAEAQTTANDAAITANNAATTAGNAQTSADSKNTVWYQTTAPAGTGHKIADTWFDTDDGNRIYQWSGTAWVAAQLGTNAIASGAVDSTRLATAVNTSITNAQNSADSKNTVWYQTAAPSGTAHKVGDTWFDTDDGNRIYRWDGSAWVAAQFGVNAIADLAITNAKIADATIASAKIAALDAGKITTGTLDANRIGANSITAAKIAANTITAAEIASNAVTADEIAANTITAAEMVAGTITAASGIIADAAITNAKIADGTIQSAKIGTLDAGKITSGTIDTARLGAKSITAEKIQVADFTDFVPDPYFKWSAPHGTQKNSGDAGVPTGSPQPTLMAVNSGYDGFAGDWFPVQLGEKYYVEAWVAADAAVPATARIYLGLWTADTPVYGGNSYAYPQISIEAEDARTWVKVSGEVTVPNPTTGTAAPKWGRVRIGAGGQSGWYMTGYHIRRKNAGELIVDGAISADKLAANAVVAGKIAAGSITANDLATDAVVANKIAAGAITTEKVAADSIQANHIKAGAITVSHLSAGIGGELDITANTAITTIVGNVETNSATAADTATALAEMKTVYSFTADGATITTPNSAFSLALKSDRIEMKSGETVLSSWTGGIMDVPRLKTDTVVLGNHQLEKYGSGSVVRALT